MDLRRRIRNWLLTEDICSAAPMPYNGTRTINESTPGINITIYQADGGKIIQMGSYDMRTDKHISNLYIIKDDEDFGQELALIITKECLKK